MKYKIIVIAIGFAVLYWILDSTVMSLVLHEGNFVEQMFKPDLHHIWMRSVAMGISITFGVYAQFAITKRKQIEEALRLQSEISANMAEGVVVSRARDGVIIYTNKRFEQMFGYGEGELLGKHVSALNASTDESSGKKARGIIKDLIGTGTWNGELQNIKKDGTLFWCRANVSTLEHTQLGKIWVAAHEDITERKWIEEALWESEQNFRNSLDSSPLGIRIVTAKGELLYANQAILDIYGYSSVEELKSVPAKQRYIPGSYAEHQIRKAKRKQGKPVPADYEISIVRKDGEVRHLAVFRKAVIWGGEIQFQMLYRDITEQKRVEMALRQSEEFNSSLLTNSPSPILVLDADGSITYVNPALEKLTGFSSAELIGSKPPYPWWIEGARVELSQRLVQAMRRDTRKYESLHKKKNGERFWVEKIFQTVKVNGEFKYYLVNWVDLTEQKRLKANMEFYLSQVTRAQEEERKRIAREIHDESIQSLATLALGIDAIARKKEKLPEDVILRLKGLRAETNAILDALRHFSHELRPGVLDHVGLVPALEILVEEMNKENRVKTSLTVAGSEQRLTTNIALVLFRIAQEALRNVKRHSGATQSVIRLKFIRSRVKLTVSDNGRGFEPPDTLSDFAIDGKLGLIGMQERTRLLGGKLLVRSRIGKGTIILVEVAGIQGMKGKIP